MQTISWENIKSQFIAIPSLETNLNTLFAYNLSFIILMIEIYAMNKSKKCA